MINIENSEKWVAVTDGTAISAIQKLETNNQFTSGWPYVVTADTLPELLAKMYVNPQPYTGEDEDLNLIGGYYIEDLTQKSSEDIIANAEVL